MLKRLDRYACDESSMMLEIINHDEALPAAYEGALPRPDARHLLDAMKSKLLSVESLSTWNPVQVTTSK